MPGHGPITDRFGIKRMRDYFVYVKAETRARFDAGMPADKAAYDIALDAFASWSDAERIVTTVDTLYREFRGESGDPNIIGHFGAMARYRNANSHSR